MVKIEYICDKCKAVQETYEQFWRVAIGLGLFNSYKTEKYDEQRSQQWCRACCEKMGLLRGDNHPEKQVPPAPVPTFEDLLRDLIREEIGNNS
jgi:hypothetical protein